MAMEIVKENIECEQLLGENFCDTVVKGEYVIPDTNPDVSKVLMLDVKPSILSKEVMQEKVYVEGQIEYNILYLAKEEDKDSVYNVQYSAKFMNYIEIPNAEHKMNCEVEYYVEHMESNIVNERKLSVEGIIKLKAEVYKNYNFEIIKDLANSDDVQMLKNPTQVDKIVGNVSSDLIAKCHMEVPVDKPEVGKVLKCNVDVHKRNVRVLDEKVQIECCALVGILYKEKNGRDVVYLEKDVLVNKDIDVENVNSSMDNYTSFIVDATEFDVKENDLGENRIIDIEALIKTSTKVMCKEEMDTIEDAYSPSIVMNMTKQNYELNVMHGQSLAQTIVKGDIEVSDDMPKVSEIVMSSGKVSITDKKLIEDKLVVEGVLNADVMYKTSDEDKYLYTVDEEIPFTASIDIPGAKIEMQNVTKAYLESIEASVEAGNIAIKAIVSIYGRVNYIIHKEFLTDIVPVEGETPKKKASITIYVVQNADTLWKIAKKYGTTVDVLTQINDIENPDYIKPGQKLIIPGRAIV